MKRKFLTLVENTITRYNNGGILTGDMVRLVDGYKSMDCYKNCSKDMQKYIDDYFNTDKNIIVTNIKSSDPSYPSGNVDFRGTGFTAEVAHEIGSGRYDNQGKVSVPLELLQQIDVYPNRHPVPDSEKYDNKIKMKPEEAEENKNDHQTMTMQGDRLQKTNLTNPKQNTTLRSSPATPSPEVTSYTKNYLPKE